MSRALVEQAMHGDHAAFALLAGQAISRLHSVAWLILRNQHDAEDAVQDALICAWRELPRLRDAERFDAWLRRLLVNACHDVSRRQRRHVLVQLIAPAVEPAAVDGWQVVEVSASSAARIARVAGSIPVSRSTPPFRAQDETITGQAPWPHPGNRGARRRHNAWSRRRRPDTNAQSTVEKRVDFVLALGMR
jgi:Sigma-70 region 2